MHTEFININGQEFFIRCWGDATKPALLLLHGFPEYGGAWQELADHLVKDFYCIAPDLRGFGQSWKPKQVKDYRMSLIVQDVIGIMAHYSPHAPIHLLGHDWGAAAAYSTACAIPEKISKLVILNGVHPIPFQAELAKGGAQAEASQYINWLRKDGSAQQLAANDFEKLIGLLQEGMDCDWFDEKTKQKYLAEWTRDNAIETMVNWYKASPFKVPPLGQELKVEDLVPLNAAEMRIQMPHLIVWGQQDVALTLASRDGIYELCDDVEIVELEKLDHWLHHQNPALIAEQILKFL